ncbi:MAG: transposase, partial [Proteobacteria bacterium]|nr:transposase [Pseudomonadota bacterium]
MKIRKTFQFKLKPSISQTQVLRNYMGCARFTYNKALVLQKELYEKEQRKLSYPELVRYLVVWKKDAEISFLKEAPAQILQQKLMDLEKSYVNFFKRGAGLPKFKKRGRRETCRFPDAKQITLDQKNKRVHLPKIGWVQYWKSRDVIGTLKNVTISYEGGDWFISFQVEQEIETSVHPSTSMAGIDLGIAYFATLSNGDQIPALNSLKKYSNALKCSQKKLSRKKKGSQNWKKHCKKLARKHKKIRNCRKDFLHKTST